jgi:hypothetical protein
MLLSGGNTDNTAHTISSNTAFLKAVLSDPSLKSEAIAKELGFLGNDERNRKANAMELLVDSTLALRPWQSYGPVSGYNVNKIADAIVEGATQWGISNDLLLKLLSRENSNQIAALRVDTVTRIVKANPKMLENQWLAGEVRHRACNILPEYDSQNHIGVKVVELLGLVGGKRSVSFLSGLILERKQLPHSMKTLATIWKDDPETALLAFARATRNFDKTSEGYTIAIKAIEEIIEAQQGTIFEKGREFRRELRAQLKDQGIGAFDRWVGSLHLASPFSSNVDSRAMTRTAITLLEQKALSEAKGIQIVSGMFRTRAKA